MERAPAQTIFFRADGSAQIGLGHVFRLLALAQMLQSAFECHFIIKNPSPYLADQIGAVCSKTWVVPAELSLEEEAAFLLENIFNPPFNQSVLVLDGYHFDFLYQYKLKAAGVKLAVVDDLHAFPFCADVLINHAGSIHREDYSAPFYTRFCLGLDFLLLRPPFLEAAKKPRLPEKVCTAFVCMGGADPLNYSQKILEEYLELIPDLENCFIVLGGAYPFQESLDKAIAQSELNITLLKGLSAPEMVSYMENAQLAICSASTICYEFLCVKGALFIVQTADNQKDLYTHLIQAKLALPIEKLGDEIDLEKMITLQQKAIDGNSPVRFRKIFQRLSANFQIRKTNPAEVVLYHQWANDPQTRAQSFSSDPIPFSSHRKWFERKLQDPDCVMLTGYCEELPVGQIRFDIKDRTAMISYSVAPGHRGKGFGRLLIKFGILHLAQTRFNPAQISGFVKPENIASSKTFKSLNFAEKMVQEPLSKASVFRYDLNLSHAHIPNWK